MRKKKIIVVVLAAALTLLSVFSSFSGQWKEDEKGKWYEEDGNCIASSWKEIEGKQYYFGADGYMLVNTTTPDGYKVGADGAWIQDDNKSQLKFNEQVLWVMGVSSYDELIVSLQNVTEDFLLGSSSQTNPESFYDYRITASNLPFQVDWTFKQQKTYMGEFLGWQPMNNEVVPYKFKGIHGTMRQIFDGLEKESYTIAEFEALVKSAGATDIMAVDRTYIDYVPGFNGSSGGNRLVKECLINFTLGKYKFFLDAGRNMTNKNVLLINETQVTMRVDEE